MNDDKKSQKYRWDKEPLKPRQLNKSDLTQKQFEDVHKDMLEALKDGRMKQEEYDEFMNN